MNLTDLVPLPYRLAAGALLVAMAIGAALAYRAHLVDEGRDAADAHHAQLDAVREKAASGALAAANLTIAAKQAALDAATAALADRERDLHEQQTRATALQSDLAAGRVRLPVAARCAGGGAAGKGQIVSAAGLDPQPAIAAELDPQAAVRLSQLTGTGDDAIVRLNACIVAYDAAVKAVNP